MIIAVGSRNPVKIQAVKLGCTEKIGEVEITGIEAESGIPSQPRSDAETQTGAKNRAKNAFEAVRGAKLGVGLEGGVQETAEGLMNTVWACVYAPQAGYFCANGERFILSKSIAEPIRSGKEMGPVMDGLMKEHEIRKGRGMIGVVTRGYVDRTEAYAHLVKVVVGLWHGRDWEKTAKL